MYSPRRRLQHTIPLLTKLKLSDSEGGREAVGGTNQQRLDDEEEEEENEEVEEEEEDYADSENDEVEDGYGDLSSHPNDNHTNNNEIKATQRYQHSLRRRLNAVQSIGGSHQHTVT